MRVTIKRLADVIFRVHLSISGLIRANLYASAMRNTDRSSDGRRQKSACGGEGFGESQIFCIKDDAERDSKSQATTERKPLPYILS